MFRHSVIFTDAPLTILTAQEPRPPQSHAHTRPKHEDHGQYRDGDGDCPRAPGRDPLVDDLQLVFAGHLVADIRVCPRPAPRHCPRAP